MRAGDIQAFSDVKQESFPPMAHGAGGDNAQEAGATTEAISGTALRIPAG